MLIFWSERCVNAVTKAKGSSWLRKLKVDALTVQCMHMYIWGFRERQHLRSLAPVMNDYGGQMILGGPWGLKLPDICLTDEEKPRENLTQKTCPDRGSNPGPLRDRRACHYMIRSGGLQSREELAAFNVAVRPKF